MTNPPLVIVSCTDRKSLSVSKPLMARNLPQNRPLDEIAEQWISTIRTEIQVGASTHLRDLYQGEYWRLAQQIESQHDTVVASAGLGMHFLEDKGIGYNATFTHGVADSIVRSENIPSELSRQLWWRALNRPDGVGRENWKFLNEPNRGRRNVLVAISESYQHALSQDLLEIADTWANVVVISGSKPYKEIATHSRIKHLQVSQKLRMVLGGSTPCIGVRFLADYLSVFENGSFEDLSRYNDRLIRKYQKLPQNQKLPSFNRLPLKDDSLVTEWIAQTIRRNKITKPTKSGLLRLLRDSGMACEQKRFGNLFDDFMGSQS